MGVLDGIFRVFGAVPAGEIEKRISEAVAEAYLDANDGLDDSGYREISRGVRAGDVSHSSMIDTAWKLYQSSPTAKRVLTIKRDHIVSRAVSPKINDENAQLILSDFWRRNDMKQNVSKFCLQLFMFGELCTPVFVRESDGAVNLGYIDPADIECIITRPGNVMDKVAVVLRESVGQSRYVYRIINSDFGKREIDEFETKMLADYGLSGYSGECFFITVNSVCNQERGYSDLLPVADWVDMADEVLFSLAEREQIAGLFVWDVTLTGATASDIQSKRMQIRNNPPKKGSVLVHNDAEAWELKTVNLNQSGTLATYEAILTMILGGMGFPRHWFGSGKETNRATAYAQADPTEKTLEHDQAIFEDYLLMLSQYQLSSAGIETDEPISMNMPEINSSNMAEVVTAIQSLAQSLMIATAEGWITKEQAAQAWINAASSFGVTIEDVTMPDTGLNESIWGNADDLFGV